MAVQAGLAEGSACLAFSAAHGVSCRDHRDYYFDDLVDHLECPSGRAGESESDDEPGEGTVVFPWVAGNARLLRSVDCRGGDAHAHHLWFDGDSLYRYEPAGRGVLHVEAAEVCDWDFSFRVHCAVGVDDHYRDVYSRAGLAVVLAGADLGPQPVDL